MQRMQRLTSRRALVALVLLATASCAGYLALSRRDKIRIPHDKHAAAKVECLTCHEASYDSKQLGDRVSPPEKTCMQCHKDKQQDCAMCHTDIKARTAAVQAKPPAKAPLQPLIMSHAGHIERVKEDCAACHKDLPNPLRDDKMHPSMDTCLGCHEHKRDYDDGNCRLCHTDLKSLPLKPVSDFTHQGKFLKEHKRAARSATATCATCHDQTFCTDCHASTVAAPIERLLPERVERDFIHRNDFRSRHSIEARADAVSCARCHGQSFCSSCHEAQNLTPTQANPRTPHPPGYALPGSPHSHGADARRDIVSCASCHDQGAQSICVDCHRTGGIGGNPHPSGWAHRHPRSEIAGNNMCLTCHQ